MQRKQSTTWPFALAVSAALAGTWACGGAVSSAADAGPGEDAAPMPIVIYLGFDAAPPDASTEDAPATLPCSERAVPAACSKSDPPYYTAASLEAAWTDCGGTSGVADQCGVLVVGFDPMGCASIEFSAAASGAGAVACLQRKLDAYRFECSAGSGISLNHLCN